MIATKRPRTCPPLLFSYFLAVVVANILLITRAGHASPFQRAAEYASMIVAGTACCVILAMPFRTPSTVSPDISAVGKQPDSHYRSPEDNLRLWQFLSVSWMAPLMSIGRSRQLNESDVWFLPFEWHHQRLHQKFRQLQGSVLDRLLQANGIDLFIVTLLAMVQMICGISLFNLPTFK